MERHVYEQLAEVEADHWWFNARRAIVLAALMPRLAGRPAPRVLDAGCGTGGNLAFLRSFAGHLDAMELDDTAREVASRKSGLAVQPGHLPDAVPFPSGAFDLVTLFDVLEHVEDDVGALKALADRLADDGHMLLTVPAFPFLWSRHDEEHHHRRRYTASTLKRQLQGAGLEVVHLSYFNTVLFPLVAGVRLLGKLSRQRVATDDARMPPGPLNALLYRLMAAERHMVAGMGLPFGVSLLAVARRST